MGDGGVACMQLQQHHMERFPIPEKTLYSSVGKNGSNSNNNGFNSKSLKFADTERKKKMKVKKEQLAKNVESEKSELGSNRVRKSSKEVENGEICAEKAQKDEVEEGELGTLNGDYVSRRSEIEKGEIVEKWRRSEVEKGEIVLEKTRRGEPERGEFGLWRGAKDEIEKGEFIPDRWHKGEAPRDEYNYGKSRRYDSGKEKGCKSELERTPPSGKYLGDDVFRRKDFNRSGSQLSKGTPRWESGQERNIRISSKIVDEEGLYRNEYSNGKNHGRDCSSANRLKRYGADSDSNDRKYYGDYGDYAGSKSRRLSDDSNRTAHLEHYSRRSVERPYRNLASSKMPSSDKYSSRHYESSLSSRVVYDRYGRSPGHSERSPHDRARFYDHRDRSPVRRERSPHGRERSPHGRERSPYGRERSPYGRERSPYDRNRPNDHRNRSPIHAERSPHDRARNHDRRDRTPSYLERSPLDRSRPSSYRETSRKGGTSEKRNSQIGSKAQEDKLTQRDSNGEDSQYPAKESQDKSSVHNVNGSVEKNVDSEPRKEEQSQSPSINCNEASNVDGPLPEELPSMEEDMDICDTPPHVPIVADSSTGKWFYLDYYGVECGPSKLCDLKALMEEGALMSDHLIKHVDTDRWVTVENATSPLVTLNFPFIVSDTITQLVKPPEAPGNLLADTGDTRQSGPQSGEEISVTLSEPVVRTDDTAAVFEPSKDLHIDARVGALLEGFPVIPGKELETVAGISLSVNYFNFNQYRILFLRIWSFFFFFFLSRFLTSHVCGICHLAEVLQMKFEQAEWQEWVNSEGRLSLALLVFIHVFFSILDRTLSVRVILW